MSKVKLHDRSPRRTARTRLSKVEGALLKCIKAWDTLPGDKNYPPSTIESWLRGSMAPAISRARRVIK